MGINRKCRFNERHFLFIRGEQSNREQKKCTNNENKSNHYPVDY